MALIAIAGATGTVGSKLTKQLLQGGARVRLLSRSPDKAKALFDGPNVEAVSVVGVDFDSTASLRQAFEGADSAFLCTGTSERQVRDEIALIDAAVHAGVSHLVGLSVAGAGRGIANNVLQWHSQIDAHLMAQDAAWTLLRPTTYADTLLRVASSFVPSGAWGGVAEDGRICAIDTRDVATCAAVVLREGAQRHGGQVHELSGPSAVRMDDIAGFLAEGLGRPVNYVRRTADAQRALYASVGLRPLAIDVLLGLDDLTRSNVYAEPASGVLALTSQVPRSVEALVQERIADFAKAAKP